MGKNTVPLYRPDLPTGLVKATKSVSASYVRNIGSALNWAIGQQRTMIPFTYIGYNLTAGSAHIIPFQFKRPEFGQVMNLHIYASGQTYYDVELDTGIGGSTYSWTHYAPAYDGITRLQNSLAFEDRGSSGTNDGTITITPDSTLGLRGYGLFGYPVTEIDSPFDVNGVPVDTVRRGERIDDDSSRGWYRTAREATEWIARWVTFMNWGVPYSVGGATSTAYAQATTSTSFTDVFGVDVPLIGAPFVTPTQAFTIVNADVFAWIESGGGAEVRFTSSYGDSVTHTINSTTPAWYTGDVNVDPVDLTASDGIPSSPWPDVAIEFRSTVAGKNVYIAGVHIAS